MMGAEAGEESKQFVMTVMMAMMPLDEYKRADEGTNVIVSFEV